MDFEVDRTTLHCRKLNFKCFNMLSLTGQLCGSQPICRWGGDVHFKPDCMGNLGMFLSKQQHRGSDWSVELAQGSVRYWYFALKDQARKPQEIGVINQIYRG